MKILKELFFLFKVHHWVKNLVIFLPIFVSNSMFLFELSEYFFHFFNFSIITSIIYFLNNVYDYEQDLLNKELKYKISKNKYKYFFFGIIFSIIHLALLFFYDFKLFIIIFVYFILAMFYNIILKKIKYLDVIVLALFHLFRIFYGSIAFNIDITINFILFCLSVFLMIALNKRLNELNKKYKHRPYNNEDKKKLITLQSLSGFFIVIIFLYYILNPSNNGMFVNNSILFLNLIILILIIVNFLYFSKNKEQDVIIFIYKNKLNLLLSFSFLLLFSYNHI